MVIKGRESVADVHAEESFLRESMCFLKRRRDIADYVEKPQANVVMRAYPRQVRGIEVILWGTYVTDITRAEENLLATFHPKHRNVIRKAIKDGVEISLASVQEIYDCISSTLARQKVHAPSMHYYKMLKKSIPENVGFYKATLNGNIEGVAVVIYDCNCGYYMYGGSSEHHHVGSVNLLQYHIMLELQRKGVKKYDLVGARVIYEEGSKFDGIQRFKARFASCNPQGYVFRYVINPFKYKIFIMLVKIYGLAHGFRYSDSITSTLKLMNKRGLTID